MRKVVKYMKEMPSNLVILTEGYSWEQVTIGQSEADTFLLKGPNHRQYLKIQPVHSRESLQDEKEKLAWLQDKLPVPEVIHYEKDEANEYLLIKELKGHDASSNRNKISESSIMRLMGIGLKQVHEVRIGDCPFDQTLDSKIKGAKNRVENGLVDEEDFDRIREGLNAQQIFVELIAKKPLKEALVFTHGDYCCPNIILNEGGIGGFIDMGRAGIADRYQDLALAIRSIESNYGKEQVSTFLEAYGLKNLDENKVYYYQLMDEFF